jgi:competence protein CoiA
MFFAQDKNGQMVEPMLGAEGSCRLCGVRAIPKCGEINVWHWAHETLNDCDPWFEAETIWHRRWKKLVRPEFCEVPIDGHRADLAFPGKFGKRMVMELQHSPIKPATIRQREQVYQNMIWIFDAGSFVTNIDFRPKYKSDKKKEDSFDDGILELRDVKDADFFTFRWKHPRKSLFEIHKPIFFDLSENSYYHGNPCLFHVKKLYPEVPCGGWGVFVSLADFVKTWMPENVRTPCQP